LRGPARVLFFDHTAVLGGGEIALYNLVRHLDPKLVKPLVLLSADGPLADRLRSDIETHILPLPEKVTKTKKESLGIRSLLRVNDIATLALYTVKVARFLRSHSIDLIHTNSLKSDVIGGVAGRLVGCPVLWHIRDRIEDDYLPTTVVHALRALSRWVPNYVVANSAATLATLRLPAGRKQQNGTCSNSRFAVVHDGLDPQMINNVCKSRTACVPTIGLIGRICPWKGQHIFLQAAAHVIRSFPEALFKIIGAPLFGEQAYDSEMRQLSSDLGLDLNVEFTGFRSDIAEAISDLDLIVHASVTGEPFGQVIIEAMAAGKPVVATNGGGVPEIVMDGRTGILVPMGDSEAMATAICKILTEPLLAAQMGNCGRERVKRHFTIQETAEKIVAVYGRLLENRQSSLA
jgi:glycosyltransferase involved in cell wall biosynthesis